MPLRIETSERAEAQVDQILRLLVGSRGADAAERFLQAYESALLREGVLVEIVRRPLAVESQALRRDLYPVIVRGGGVWRVLYELLDVDRDGVVETLRIFAVASASRGDGD